MKKQYIFLTLLLIISYILYRIISFTYEKYEMNSNIEHINKIIDETKEKNLKAIDIIEYKKSKAYRNYVLKSEQSFKNKGEQVVYLTTEKKYNKFTKEPEKVINQNILPEEKKSFIDNMNAYEKWFYFLFKIDIR